MEEQDLELAFRVAHGNYLQTESILLGMLSVLYSENRITLDTLKTLKQEIGNLHRWADEKEIALRKEIQRKDS